MTRLTRTLFTGLAIVVGVAIAQAAATDPDVIARQALMKTVGGSVKTLGGFASGQVPFDAAAAETAKAALLAAALDIEAKFMTQTADPEQEAKPAVWTSWADFLVKAKALSDAAAAVDATSAEGVAAGMGAIGGTCRDCHSTYRS